MNKSSIADLDGKADLLVRLLTRGPGHPLVLVSNAEADLPAFVKNSLALRFDASGFLPVYVDFTAEKQLPLRALNSALDAAATGIVSEERDAIRGLVPELQTGQWLDLLQEQTSRPLVLLLDALPECAGDAYVDSDIASIRATLTVRSEWVRVIISSAAGGAVQRLFGRQSSPMYQFATSLGFPSLQFGAAA